MLFSLSLRALCPVIPSASEKSSVWMLCFAQQDSGQENLTLSAGADGPLLQQ